MIPVLGCCGGDVLGSRNIDRVRFLRGVLVGIVTVGLQTGDHAARDAVLRQHAAHGQTHDLIRSGLEVFAEQTLTPTRMCGV